MYDYSLEWLKAITRWTEQHDHIHILVRHQ